MKFALVAVFTLALAMGISASVIPLAEVAGHGLSYTAVSRPAVVVAAPHVVAHGPAAVDVHAWGVHPWGVPAAHWPVVSAPAISHAHHVAVAPAPAVVAPVVVAAPAHEGTYVAKTRGAVHTAPLSGHAQSVASVNVAPAPGTV